MTYLITTPRYEVKGHVWERLNKKGLRKIYTYKSTHLFYTATSVCTLETRLANAYSMCTYKFFLRRKNVEVTNWRARTIMVHINFIKRAYGKCFMPLNIVNQSKEYWQDIHHNIPLYWAVHHTTSIYMDRDGWLKAVTQFSNICGASPVKNYILLFGEHYSHFNDRALIQTQRKKSIPSYLKQVTQSTTSPMTTGLTQNWRLSTTLQRISGYWSILPLGFNLTTWTLSWLKHGRHSWYQLLILPCTASLKFIYYHSTQPTWKKYTGMCSIDTNIFKKNKSYCRRHTCTY